MNTEIQKKVISSGIIVMMLSLGYFMFAFAILLGRRHYSQWYDGIELINYTFGTNMTTAQYVMAVVKMYFLGFIPAIILYFVLRTVIVKIFIGTKGKAQ